MSCNASAVAFRSSARRRPFVLAIALSLLLTACSEPEPNFALSGLPSLVPTWHQLDSGTTDFCSRQGWDTCPIWIATDDQRFHVGRDSLGPVAFIAPASDLATKSSRSAFQVLEAVAVIRVDPDNALPLPDSYTAFNLSVGFNCVYAQYVGGVGYQAYVIPPVTGPTPCPASPANPGTPYVVLEDTPFTTPPRPGEVPNVARFHEGTERGLQRPRAFFGFKCGTRWCMVLPPNTRPDPLPHNGAVPKELRWVVRGWHDAQHLSVVDRPDERIKYSSENPATVAPGEGAAIDGLENFEGRWVHAATVHFRNNPTHQKYTGGWKFHAGMNEVYIQKERGSNRWAGRVKLRDGWCGAFWWLMGDRCYKDLSVDRADHNKPDIPATARFRWDEHDEGVWVRCDDGCCKVSGT
jgi:hypothetical protein